MGCPSSQIGKCRGLSELGGESSGGGAGFVRPTKAKMTKDAGWRGAEERGLRRDGSVLAAGEHPSESVHAVRSRHGNNVPNVTRAELRSQKGTAGGRGSGRLFLLTVLVLAITYGVVDFLLIPGNRLELHPVHHDDYMNLSKSVDQVSSRPPRPASTLAIGLLASAGPRAYRLASNVLTIVYPALVVLFLARLIGRNPGLIELFVFAALLFSFPASLDWVKYTGLITNLLSGTFGVLALLFLHRGLAGETRRPAIAAGLLFYAVSIFSKEDFVLPVFLLVGFHLTRPGARGGRAAIVVFGAAACVFALLLYNSTLPHSFTSLGASGPYQVHLSPGSVASTILRYLTLSPFLVGALIVSFAAGAGANLADRESRPPILLAFAIIGSLILPYAVLPNHMAPYYAFGWLAWMTGLIAVSLSVLAVRVRWPALVYAISVLLAIFAVRLTHGERSAIVRWYANESERNDNITHTLVENRAALASLPTVGIVGVAGLSPWSRSDGDYLRTRLHLRNRWIVFVARSDIFYSLNDSHGKVHVRSLASLARSPQLPLLVFDTSGRGRLVRPQAERRSP